jgi:alpha-1,3-glucan synthase
MPYDKALTGCDDDWNSLDHFDPTADARRLISQMMYIREEFPATQDGLNLVQLGNWTHFIQLPGSNTTKTEIGMWSTQRSPLPTQVNMTAFQNTPYVWLMYTNENDTVKYEFDCKTKDWISTPYTSGTTVKNLFYPYEEHTLQDSLDAYNYDDKEPWRGCLPEITLRPYDFKAFVPVADWKAARPMMSKTTPGHDARVPSNSDNTLDIAFEYDVEMNCQSLTNALTINYSLGNSTLEPKIRGTPTCRVLAADEVEIPEIAGVPPSGWRWSATVENAPDGLYEFIIGSVSSQSGNAQTGSTDHVIVRKGADTNVMVNIDATYRTDNMITMDNGDYYINHAAPGADRFRYSGDFKQTWSDWADYETTTKIDTKRFEGKWWKGQHVIVQYWSRIAGSSATEVHADYDYTGQRRFPQLMARGAFNNWGYDSGTNADLENDNGVWSIPVSCRWIKFPDLCASEKPILTLVLVTAHVVVARLRSVERVRL